jgi:LPXTG-site transpeptidase (sortase) family protein
VQVADPAVTKSGDPAIASIGDTVVFTLIITNNGNVDAYNVVATDAIPAFLDINSVVVTPVGPTVDVVGNTITLGFDTLSPGETYTVTITTVVNSTALPPGGTNNVTLTTTSPDSDPTNNLDSAALAIVERNVEIPDTGFAPGRVTRLPLQLEEDAYVTYGDLWLEIPRLGLRTTIVGVPQTAGGWDINWLWDQAGYLNGTAFPTWSGNSVITGHVILPTGQAGPFAELHSLSFGDRVLIHAWGLRYVYEIRSVNRVAADDQNVFRHEDRSWLTLVTCQDYDVARDRYRWRVTARAVLVAIEADDSSGVEGGPVTTPAEAHLPARWHDDP